MKYLESKESTKTDTQDKIFDRCVRKIEKLATKNSIKIPFYLIL